MPPAGFEPTISVSGLTRHNTHNRQASMPPAGFEATISVSGLTTRNTHNRKASMPPAGFELTISAGKRPQTYLSDHAATGIGSSTEILRTIMC